MTTTEIPNHESVAPLWKTRDLAKFLGCSERQIPRLRDEGLPALRVGGLVRFIPSRVMAWLDDEPEDERARQLADIAASGDEDNAECAAADLARHITATNNCPSKLPLVQSPTPKVPSKFSPNL